MNVDMNNVQFTFKLHPLYNYVLIGRIDIMDTSNNYIVEPINIKEFYDCL